MSHNTRTTRKLELVETANLSASLHRLRNGGPHDCDRWKRALYHALCMEVYDAPMKENIRKALGLP